ncbi:pilus assembly protein PilM [Candidatus Saccharibacteria bacterium]|nr:pilus assembly protein PilM [Candidatus Saccharibacteria bacterium]
MREKFSQLKSVAFGKLKTPNTTDNYIVALDIGTDNVKAVIVKQVDSTLEVVGAGRAHQGLQDMQAGAISDIQAVVANCDEALDIAEKSAGVTAKQVVVGIAGELIKGITNSVKVSRENPEKELDVKEVDELARRVQSEAYRQAKEELSIELSTSDIELKLINSAVVEINIDGHKVTNPLGFQGKIIELQMYTAYAPLVHIGAIERTAAQLDLELLAVAAEPFAVARSVIGNNPDASDNVILIDVGGGTTDIAVLRDGGLEGTRMFGIGGRVFTKSIARDLGVDFIEAEKLKIGLSTGEVHQAQKQKVEAAIEKTANIWIQGVSLALAEFDWLDYLPHTILLCGGGSSLAVLRTKLTDKEWQKDLPFSKIVEPKFIQPEDIKDMRDKTGEIKDHTMITVMGLARVGADTRASTTSRKSKLSKLLEN